MFHVHSSCISKMRILKAVSKKVSVVNIELSLKFGWLSERRGNFLNLLQKEGVPRKCVCVWGGSSLRKGGLQPWRKLWIYNLVKHQQWSFLQKIVGTRVSSLIQVFSCEFLQSFQEYLFQEHHLTATGLKTNIIIIPKWNK